MKVINPALKKMFESGEFHKIAQPWFYTLAAKEYAKTHPVFNGSIFFHCPWCETKMKEAPFDDQSTYRFFICPQCYLEIRFRADKKFKRLDWDK